jgi:hypothetical protein
MMESTVLLEPGFDPLEVSKFEVSWTRSIFDQQCSAGATMKTDLRCDNKTGAIPPCRSGAFNKEGKQTSNGRKSHPSVLWRTWMRWQQCIPTKQASLKQFQRRAHVSSPGDLSVLRDGAHSASTGRWLSN